VHTWPSGINDNSAIVGTVSTTSHNRRFTFDDGNLTFLDVTGARETDARGINNLGEIVGDYYDASGHGFLATPVPLPPNVLLLGSGLLGLVGWRRYRKG
jgi:uncharacterized membrane protein